MKLNEWWWVLFSLQELSWVELNRDQRALCGSLYATLNRVDLKLTDLDNYTPSDTHSTIKFDALKL